MRDARTIIGVGLALVATIAAACRHDETAPSADGADASVAPAPANGVADSAAARERLEELRARFPLGAGVARGFEVQGGVARPILPAGAAAVRPATVRLPLRAGDAVSVEDDASHVAVRFTLRGAGDAPLAISGGTALYARALGGADVVHRVHATGTEDYVVFEQRPEVEELAYDVDVSHAAGLRLVGSTLELLDETGTPRLHVAPPYVVGPDRKGHWATLAVDGCAYDTSAAPPWGRAVTRPGAARCAVRVRWADAHVGYPAMVDPSWTTTGSLALARSSHTATLLTSGKVLFVGGHTNSFSNATTAELYDPSAGTFAATGNPVSPRSYQVASVLTSGKVLIAGGLDANGYSSTGEVYDPGTGAFTAASNAMSAPRQYANAVTLGTGKVLVVGGSYYDSTAQTTVANASADLYDPTTNAFAPTGAMKTARNRFTATLLGSGKVLAAGGDNGVFTNYSTAEMYDPATGAFTQLAATLPAERSNQTATLLASGKVLLAGGYNAASGYLQTADLFDPSGAGSFAATGNMTARRGYQTATLLDSGKVLIAGGYVTSVLSSAELFDPSSGTFTATTSMQTARTQATATRLSSGKVLVAGGRDLNNDFASAELYDLHPAGGSCSTADDCTSGVCEDGVCCSGACSGTCMTCAAGTGACVAVKSADDPDTCAGTKTCDPSGACKLKVGQACPNGNGDCANAQCADGFCCNTACGGACDVCATSLGATANGTCGPATAGYAGNPACGSGFACNGTSPSCPSSCASDADCLAGDYCAANGTCQARKAQGGACNVAAGADCKTASCRECASGFCVDGVCCDTACNTLCQACAASLKQSGMADGTCGPAKDDTNPHNDTCPVDAPATCGHDGKCDGTGGCRLYYPAGTSCGASQCIAGNKAAGDICNGSGVCATNPAGVACDPYVCKGTTCPTSCTADGDCITGDYCKQGACVPLDANGTACGSGVHCKSGICVDGVCCNVACGGQCQACDVQGAEGSCTAVAGAPHGARQACAGGDPSAPCAATLCDGVTPDSCTGFVGSSTSCRTASCTNGVQTLPASCDGKGHCPAVVTKSCAPYGCDATTNACKTGCASDADCTGGTKCSSGKCVSGATCADDHTMQDPSGTKTPCDPYICAGGACKTTCGSVSDCVGGDVCDATGHCVAPPMANPNGGGDSGGCSASPTPAPAGGGALAVIGAVGLALVRRRRARR